MSDYLEFNLDYEEHVKSDVDDEIITPEMGARNQKLKQWIIDNP